MAAVGCGPSGPAPDIMLVVLDTVRADAVGGRPGEPSVTPSLDALAARATVFDTAYAAAPWTVPSHASLFTGTFPHHHRATHDTYRLDDARTTLAEVLAGAGYQTAGFTTNPWLATGVGLAQGFEHYHETFKEATDDPDQGSRRVTGQVLRWLDDRDPGRPSFVFVNYVQAHLPYEPPEDAVRRVGGAAGHVSVEQAEAWLAGDRSLSRDGLRRAYLAEVADLDAQVGTLLQGLEERGLLERTLLVITSDHGELLGEHGLTGHEFALAEELLRVPLIVHGPGFGAGTRPDPVSLVDIVPTLVAAAAAQPPRGVDGRSLIAERAADRPLLAEYARPRRLVHGYWRAKYPDVDMSRYDRALRSLRSGDLKLVLSSRGEEWLFDLAEDPGETRDLASTHPDRVAALRDELARSLGAGPRGGP